PWPRALAPTCLQLGSSGFRLMVRRQCPGTGTKARLGDGVASSHPDLEWRETVQGRAAHPCPAPVYCAWYMPRRASPIHIGSLTLQPVSDGVLRLDPTSIFAEAKP